MMKSRFIFFGLAILFILTVFVGINVDSIIDWATRFLPRDEGKSTGYYRDLAHLIILDAVLFAFCVLLILFLLVNSNARKVFMWTENALMKSPRRSVLLILLIFVVITSWVGVVSLDQFPNSADEFVYLFQAEDMSHGRFSSSAHELPEFFEFHHLLQKDGIWVGRFPPGYPMILSIAYILHLPPFVINLVLGLILLFCFHRFVNEVYNERIALWSLVILTFTGFFIFNSASFFSHVTSGLFSLLCVWMLYRYFGTQRMLSGVLAGLFLGMVLITRYYTALLVILPFIAYAIYRLKAKSFRLFLFMTLGGIFPLAFLLLYNYSTTGNAFMLVTQWGFADEALGFVRGHTPARGLKFTLKRMAMFIYWCSPQLLLLYGFYLIQKVRKFREAVDHPEDYLFILLIIGYFFYYHSGGNQYGPRFYFEALPFLIVFVVVRVMNSGAKFPLALLISSLLFQVVKIPMIASHENEVIVERQDVYTQVHKEGISNAIVFISSDASVLRPMPPEDLNRNDKRYQNGVLYARDLGEKNIELVNYYPSRKFYRYVRDIDKAQGRLELLDFYDRNN